MCDLIGGVKEANAIDAILEREKGKLVGLGFSTSLAGVGLILPAREEEAKSEEEMREGIKVDFSIYIYVSNFIIK